MNKFNFDAMSRNELARFIVAHRDTEDGVEARRVYIRRMAEKAKKHGIDLYQPGVQVEGIDQESDR